MITSERVSTGIAGLDEILFGGLLPNQAYLVRGGPGTGKTTLGLHFLSCGQAENETALFINMGETEDQIRRNAAGRFNLDNIHFLDLSPTSDFFAEIQSYDVFSPADVEREPTTNRITSEVRALRPTRIFLDAMTHFRYLSPEAQQFRRQVHSFLRFLVEQGATVLFTSEANLTSPDDDLQYMSDGILHLVMYEYKRTITVTKFRGSGFFNGIHSMKLGSQGISVYPRLLPDPDLHHFVQDAIPSGVSEIDKMLSGGLERGTVTIITGPTGVGKTTFSLQFMKEAAERGEKSLVYTFDEWKETLVQRAVAVNIPIRQMIEDNKISVTQIEPLLYTPDEFAHQVRHDVTHHNAKIVMLDSVAGYRLAMQGEDLVSHLHALCKYLQSQGVAVLLIYEIDNIVGNLQVSNIGISYIADNIIFMRYVEIEGELHRVLGVLKKRLTDFEKTLREFQITAAGFKVGPPLTALRGILSGISSLSSTRTSDLP